MFVLCKIVKFKLECLKLNFLYVSDLRVFC